MARLSEKFVAYGFAKSNTVVFKGKKIKIEGKNPKEKLKFIQKTRKELKKEGLDKAFDAAIEGIANHEWAEIVKDQLVMTDHPKPLKRYYLGVEDWKKGVEEYYYWSVRALGDFGFPVVHKVTDVFSAAENSSFYGAAGQRLGLAQDKVGQYLATIGKMIKDLFQLVRELRWMDERLDIYRGAMGVDKEGKTVDKNGKKLKPRESAEITLKGMWVDLVDGMVGGQRTGSNLFTMAQQLQFTTLPDLFFSIHPEKTEDVDEVVEKQAGDFNKQVRNALKRKLNQYVTWKHHTYEEVKGRRKFVLDYLRQHYQVIRLYINWIKPYIKHIERLSGQQDLLNNPNLVAAFESNLVELEVIGKMKVDGARHTYSCIMLTFEYHTKPSMQYPGDSGYHRGPIHVGSTRITWRAYAWTEEEIQNYIKMRNHQDLESLTSVDKALSSAMEALGDDLLKYIDEAEKGHEEPQEEKKKKKPSFDLLEPFTAVGKGAYDIAKSVIPGWPSSSSGGVDMKADRAKAAGAIKKAIFSHYDVFKKAQGLLSW